MENLANLECVRHYLTEQRCLAARILEPLIEAGKVYADQRANAVFLMVAGKANHPIGAELRGTRVVGNSILVALLLPLFMERVAVPLLGQSWVVISPSSCPSC